MDAVALRKFEEREIETSFPVDFSFKKFETLSGMMHMLSSLDTCLIFPKSMFIAQGALLIKQKLFLWVACGSNI